MTKVKEKLQGEDYHEKGNKGTRIQNRSQDYQSYLFGRQLEK